MNFRQTATSLLSGSALLLLLACGGGGGGSNPVPPPGPVYATALTYSDPTTGSFQLKKNTGLSTPTRLVLDLVAVNAGQGAGVAFHLTLDTTRATWAKVQDSDPEYVRNGSVFNLGTGSTALKGKVKGSILQVVVSQKGLAGSPMLNGTLATIALNLPSNLLPGPISLDTVSGKMQVLSSTGDTPTIAIAKGTLAAQ